VETDPKESDASLTEPRLLKPDMEDYRAVCKPSGYLTHSVGDGVPDAVTWCLRSGLGEDFAFGHRLDKPVSGVLVGSESAEARARLGDAFAEGVLDKRYFGLVYGVARPKGIVRRKLKDGRRGRAIEAITRYRRLWASDSLSLLLLTPQTGRKHQIRRHLQGIGHPLVGDKRYGKRQPKPVSGFPGRLWLHASILEWPDAGLKWCADLPEELVQHLEHLGAPRLPVLFPEGHG